MRPHQIFPGDEQDRLRHDFFYRDGTPEVAQELLEKFLGDELPGLTDDLESGERAREASGATKLFQRMLFFVRAAGKRPALKRAYWEVAQAATRSEARCLLSILTQVADESDEAALLNLAEANDLDPANARPGKDAQLERLARAPITEQVHVDLRWVEFMATGDVGPVVDLVGVLAGPDRLRTHLEGLIRPAKRISSSFAGEQERRKQLLASLQPLGLRFDPATQAILNVDDLDLLTTVDGVELDPARLERLQAALPAPLPDSLKTPMLTKALAFTSLASNAAAHPPVLAVCAAAADKLTGAVRLTLLTLLVEAHASRREYPAARVAMRKLLEGNRGREDLRARATALLAEEQAAASPAAAEPEQAAKAAKPDPS